VTSNSLVVVGYSGRDETVMATLREGFTQPGTARLHWTLPLDCEIPNRVAELIDAATKAGREAFVVRIDDFDTAMAGLAEECLDDTRRSRARDIGKELSLFGPTERFSLPDGDVLHMVKSNAFPVKLPIEILELDIADGQGPGLWARMREGLESKSAIAAVSRGKFIGFGDSAVFREALAHMSTGAVRRTPLTPEESALPEVAGLVAETLVRGLAGMNGLPSDGRSTLWRSAILTTENIASDRLTVHEAAKLGVRRYADLLYAVLEPTVIGLTPEGAPAALEAQKALRYRLLTRQYNRQFNEAVNSWRNLLFPDSSTIVNFPGAGASFAFEIERAPLFAGIRSESQKGPRLPASIAGKARQRGILVPEPNLRFATRDGRAFVGDPHPMRGLADNRPYDFRLTALDRNPAIRVGVVSPASLATPLSAFLAKLQLRAKPDSKEEYLLPYPGFSAAFGVALSLPASNDDLWAICPEPRSADAVKAAREIADSIVRAIDRLEASAPCDLLIIGIPTRWRPYEGYTTDSDRFDLHDFVKAHCVERGVATQFIREATFSKPHECEIRRWLALAAYAKSMRTPWALEGLDAGTAFMGLGFSVRPKLSHGGHIVLGCSHIYNAGGQGLRYRLSRVERPILRGDRPFMRYDDARRLAESARQLLTERGTPLPDRLVVHRRTPYLEAEMRALRDGFAGIRELELLEITFEPQLRYVASRLVKGKLEGHNFPVSRGTAILVDDHQFLLWAHGAVPALDARRVYFQGKSRVPSPLVVTRHEGRSPLVALASELLGLSKMSWNNFEMYSQLPATLQSSQSIASIGSLLQRFGANSYDYRLFI